MLFYVIVTTFLINDTSMNRFTDSVMDDCNLDEIHATVTIETKFGIICILTFLS